MRYAEHANGKLQPVNFSRASHSGTIQPIVGDGEGLMPTVPIAAAGAPDLFTTWKVSVEYEMGGAEIMMNYGHPN